MGNCCTERCPEVILYGSRQSGHFVNSAVTVFFSISSKKYLKHFFMKLVEVELQLKAKLKVAIMIPPTLWPTAA